MTTGALGALRFLADAATFAAAALSNAALLTVAAVERTDGGESTGLAALRAARRAADGVAATSSNARERGMIARLLAIKRKGRSRRTSRQAAEKTEEKTNSEPRNEPYLYAKGKKSSCGPVITVTAEWSVHGFAGTEKRAVWRKLTPPRRRQRTTMKACLFTVTKCHKNAQSHRAPTCAPTPARCRVHSRARRLQLRVPPAHRKRHHRIYTSTHSNHHSNVQRQTPSKEKEFYPHHMVTCHILSQ